MGCGGSKSADDAPPAVVVSQPTSGKPAVSAPVASAAVKVEVKTLDFSEGGLSQTGENFAVGGRLVT